MENAQNQNPQAQIQQAQAQMIHEVITHAGLDASDPKNQQAAIEVMRAVGELQAPEREKERNALMREFGLQPDEFKRGLEAIEEQVKAIGQQAENLQNRETELQAKYNKRKTFKNILAVVGAAVAGYFSYQKKFKESDSKLTKWGAPTGLALLGGALTAWVSGLFTTKPVTKEAEQLGVEKGNLSVEYQQLEAQAQEQQYDAFRKLASRMLKERVEKSAQQPTQPEVPQVTTEVAAQTNFTQQVAGEKTPQEKILEQTPSASNVEKALASKAAANVEQGIG